MKLPNQIRRNTGQHIARKQWRRGRLVIRCTIADLPKVRCPDFPVERYTQNSDVMPGKKTAPPRKQNCKRTVVQSIFEKRTVIAGIHGERWSSSGR